MQRRLSFYLAPKMGERMNQDNPNVNGVSARFDPTYCVDAYQPRSLGRVAHCGGLTVIPHLSRVEAIREPSVYAGPSESTLHSSLMGGGPSSATGSPTIILWPPVIHQLSYHKKDRRAQGLSDNLQINHLSLENVFAADGSSGSYSQPSGSSSAWSSRNSRSGRISEKLGPFETSLASLSHSMKPYSTSFGRWT